MKLITKEVSNPEKKFWIWDEKITNKQDGRIYPHNTTNVGSGKSVAVYQLSESGKEEQIAQLEIPDYKKNKYFKNRSILKRTIEKSKFLTKLYCKIYKKKNIVDVNAVNGVLEMKKYIITFYLEAK